MHRPIAVLLLTSVLVSGRGDAQELSRTGSATDGFGTVTVNVRHLDRESWPRFSPLEPGETAFVTLWSSNSLLNGSAAPETFRATGRTDADGNVTFDRLPLGGYRVFGETGHYSGQSSFGLVDHRFEQRLSLFVQEGRAFRGRVVNVRGEPVAGAMVKMFPLGLSVTSPIGEGRSR